MIAAPTLLLAGIIILGLMQSSTTIAAALGVATGLVVLALGSTQVNAHTSTQSLVTTQVY